MAKQLFNSSDKSNFILNMTEEKFAKITSAGLLISCFATSAASAIPLLTGSKFYSATAVGLSIAGVFCMITALIGVLKKYIGKSLAVALGGAGFSLVWAVISMINSYEGLGGVSMYGFPGRDEGFLALLFYLCFFLAAAAVRREKAIRTLVVGVTAAGIFNSIMALVQVFTGKFSDYHWVSAKIQLNAASGFCQSPVFLAMFLASGIAAALMGAVIFTGKGRKTFFIVSACLFSFVTMFTFTFVGICGIILAVLTAFVMIIAVKAPKINLLSVLPVIAAACASVLLVQAGAVGNISQYRLYDGRIIWFADSYIRLGSSGMFDSENIDIDDTYDVYYTLNRKTMDIISGNKLFGTGPDQLLYPQLWTAGSDMLDDTSVENIAIYNTGTFDRVYNEYLNTAATRGIPSAAALVVTILAVLFTGFNNFRKSKNRVTLCMTLLTLMGAVLFLICCSNTAVSPIFWMTAGASCCVFGEESAQEAPKQNAAKEKKEKSAKK